MTFSLYFSGDANCIVLQCIVVHVSALNCIEMSCIILFCILPKYCIKVWWFVRSARGLTTSTTIRVKFSRPWAVPAVLHKQNCNAEGGSTPNFANAVTAVVAWKRQEGSAGEKIRIEVRIASFGLRTREKKNYSAYVMCDILSPEGFARERELGWWEKLGEGGGGWGLRKYRISLPPLQ